MVNSKTCRVWRNLRQKLPLCIENVFQPPSMVSTIFRYMRVDWIPLRISKGKAWYGKEILENKNGVCKILGKANGNSKNRQWLDFQYHMYFAREIVILICFEMAPLIDLKKSPSIIRDCSPFLHQMSISKE